MGKEKETLKLRWVQFSCRKFVNDIKKIQCLCNARKSIKHKFSALLIKLVLNLASAIIKVFLSFDYLYHFSWRNSQTIPNWLVFEIYSTIKVYSFETSQRNCKTFLMTFHSISFDSVSLERSFSRFEIQLIAQNANKTSRWRGKIVLELNALLYASR